MFRASLDPEVRTSSSGRRLFLWAPLLCVSVPFRQFLSLVFIFAPRSSGSVTDEFHNPSRKGASLSQEFQQMSHEIDPRRTGSAHVPIPEPRPPGIFWLATSGSRAHPSSESHLKFRQVQVSSAREQDRKRGVGAHQKLGL